MRGNPQLEQVRGLATKMTSHASCNSHAKWRGSLLAGMLPLARELLKRGVTVIMAANVRPSINDTTAAELTIAVRSAAEGDKLLRRAWDEQALRVMSSGSDMPVIDLNRVRIHLFRLA